MKACSRAGRVQLHAIMKKPTLTEQPRALKIIQDFNYHKASMDWARKDAAREPEMVNELSEAVVNSLPYGYKQDPLKSLLRKEGDADYEIEAWQAVLSKPQHSDADFGVAVDAL